MRLFIPEDAFLGGYVVGKKMSNHNPLPFFSRSRIPPWSARGIHVYMSGSIMKIGEPAMTRSPVGPLLTDVDLFHADEVSGLMTNK